MEKNIHLSNTTLVVSLQCNLKCRLCAVSAPYYKEPPCYSVDMLKKSVDRYFEAVDYIDKFTVNGGEPLIYPHIDEIMDHLLKYSDRMGMLEIITNSSVVPNDKLIDVLKKSDKIDILLDDYGPELSKGADKTVEIFEHESIKYRRRTYYGKDAHFGGWVDLRDVSKKDRSADETSKVYQNCAYPGPFHCFVLFGGKAYICGVYAWCVNEGIIPDNKEEYIDFLASDFDADSAKEKIAAFYDRQYFSACEYCNGFCMTSERFEPAEQLTAEELKKIERTHNENSSADLRKNNGGRV